MFEPERIPMFDYRKNDPKQLRLWPIEEDYEHENHKENNSQSISELEAKQTNQMLSLCCGI